MQLQPLFLTDAHEQQIDLITHLIQFGEEILVITGEEGSGKTALRQTLEQRLQPHWLICSHDALVQPLLSQLFTNIATSYRFDDSQSRPETLIAEFQNHLIATKGREAALLFIDNAEQLEDDALEALLYMATLQHNRSPLIKVVIFALPEMRQWLNDPRFKESAQKARYLDVQPIPTAKIGEFIQFCVAQRRFDRAPSTKQLNQIVRHSRGNPRQILMMMQLPQVAQRRDDWVRIAVGVALVAAMGLIFASIDFGNLFGGSPESETKPAPAKIGSNSSAQPLPLRPLEEAKTPIDLPLNNLAQPIGSTANSTLTNPAFSPNMLPDEEEGTARTGQPIPPPPQPEAPAAATRPLVEPRPLLAPATPTTAAPAKPPTVPAPKPTPAKPSPTPTTAETKPTTTTTAAAENKTAPKKGEPTPPAAAKPAAKAASDWLNSQPASHFTNQISAFNSPEEMRRYIAKYKLRGTLAMVTTTKDGKSSYLLTEGSYPTKEAATIASRSLPTAIKPWTRPIESLRTDGEQGVLVGGDGKPAPTAAKAATTPTAPPAKREATAIDNRPPNHYTIQLTGGSDPAKLQQLIQQHKLQGQATVLKSERDNKPWYLLVYGDYANRNAAQQAVQKLDPALQNSRPWLREISSIQEELRTR